MQIHQLKSQYQFKKAKRVGRGGKRGTYSGRGLKGQKSRAGHKIKPQIRELILKIPKKRGVGFKKITIKPVAVSLAQINKSFQSGSQITPRLLIRRGLVKTKKGQMPPIKIIGSLRLNKKFFIRGCLISEKARLAILESGGKII
jgi:large subunit ribosomal protein L15